MAADLPRFVSSPFYRHWHQRWGATDEEIAMAMPGDDVITDPSAQATRAVTIHAPAEDVWRWLVQVGCLRAGWYSNDLLDNLAHPSAESILPEFQDIEIGQWVPMSPTVSDTTAFRVAGFEPNRWMIWQQPASTWVWTLTPQPNGDTRLVTRLRNHYDWGHPGATLLSMFLFEFGDFAMMRRMLLGIKHRAETAATGPA